jgi:hypothetical protein
MRGLNLVLGRPEKAPWTPAEWRRELRRLDADVRSRLTSGGTPPLHLQDLQNVLCETAKIVCHDRYGKGIKQSHKPRREQLPASAADLIARVERLYRDACDRFAIIGIDAQHMPEFGDVVRAMTALWREFAGIKAARVPLAAE